MVQVIERSLFRWILLQADAGLNKGWIYIFFLDKMWKYLNGSQGRLLLGICNNPWKLKLGQQKTMTQYNDFEIMGLFCRYY